MTISERKHETWDHIMDYPPVMDRPDEPRIITLRHDLFREGCGVGSSLPKWHVQDKAFATFTLTPQHIYIILTDYPERVAEYMLSVANVEQDSERAIELWDAWGAMYGSREDWKPPWPPPNANIIEC